MSTSTQPGGFTGDPAEAFSPPAASGCCGGTFTSTDDTAGTGGCCGSTEAAAAGQCRAPAARQEAVDANTGCCG